MTDEEKINLREECNSLLDNVINLNISLFPELRYIQNLHALRIIDNRYVQNEGYYINDRFYEESYDTVVRILPRILKLVNEDFPENARISDKIKRANIFTILNTLGLAEKTNDYKLVIKKQHE